MAHVVTLQQSCCTTQAAGCQLQQLPAAATASTLLKQICDVLQILGGGARFAASTAGGVAQGQARVCQRRQVAMAALHGAPASSADSSQPPAPGFRVFSLTCTHLPTLIPGKDHTTGLAASSDDGTSGGGSQQDVDVQLAELRAALDEATEKEVLLLEAYEQLERWVGGWLSLLSTWGALPHVMRPLHINSPSIEDTISIPPDCVRFTKPRDVGHEVDRALGRQTEELSRLQRRTQFLEGALEKERTHGTKLTEAQVCQGLEGWHMCCSGAGSSERATHMQLAAGGLAGCSACAACCLFHCCWYCPAPDLAAQLAERPENSLLHDGCQASLEGELASARERNSKHEAGIYGLPQVCGSTSLELRVHFPHLGGHLCGGRKLLQG